MKLALIVSYLDRQTFGGPLSFEDPKGLKHLLNDSEVARWLDCKRLEGIGNGPFIDGRRG